MKQSRFEHFVPTGIIARIVLQRLTWCTSVTTAAAAAAAATPTARSASSRGRCGGAAVAVESVFVKEVILVSDALYPMQKITEMDKKKRIVLRTRPLRAENIRTCTPNTILLKKIVGAFYFSRLRQECTYGCSRQNHGTNKNSDMRKIKKTKKQKIHKNNKRQEERKQAKKKNTKKKDIRKK